MLAPLLLVLAAPPGFAQSPTPADKLTNLRFELQEQLARQDVAAWEADVIAPPRGSGLSVANFEDPTIILKELAVRGLARRILILTPASLVTQWMEELEEKFFETFTPIESPEEWEDTTRAIASYDRARQDAHAKELLRHRWDLVIVDEAHKCKNHNTARYQLLQRIRRNHLLLLTATPIQNDLRELYNLVTLLRPGHLGTWREFQRAYVSGGDSREVRQAEALRDLTSRVMIRTRRASVADVMSLPTRRP